MRSDVLADLEDFWNGSNYDRVMRRAGNEPRVARDTVLLLLEIAKELRALRELVLAQSGADGGEGAAAPAGAGGAR